MTRFDLNPFRDWLRTRGRFLTHRSVFVEELADILLKAGFPIYRLTTGIPILHPSIRAETALWVEGVGGDVHFHGTGSDLEEIYRRSPLYQVYEFGKFVHVPVTPEKVDGEFGILEDIRADGATDYMAVPIQFSDASYKAITMATRSPEGFTQAMIESAHEIADELAPVLELQTTQRLAKTLLDVYVGHQTGERVLKGEIKRGEGEVLRAAVWFSDLRGFTDLSNRLDGTELLDVLNTYFDVVTRSVEEHGGEVLKFIGDAVLAIFPFHPIPEECDASDRALAAACMAFKELNAVNEQRDVDARDRIETGIGLHMGDVFYGNVGSSGRLDFTVIGPAVNLASRIQALCRDLDQTILVSEQLASKSQKFQLSEKGCFSFKGFNDQHRVFAAA
ncbi:adenylate/guanylate cyclase domain-containing protein [Coralliovum pocilloporae]|uniref:adenylate/guanylate cyclase domain-containing protein n=1 Tax=Coralliovum pocilloporae TaxID=3066369 RepID=UPI0033073D3A